MKTQHPLMNGPIWENLGLWQQIWWDKSSCTCHKFGHYHKKDDWHWRSKPQMTANKSFIAELGEMWQFWRINAPASQIFLRTWHNCIHHPCPVGKAKFLSPADSIVILLLILLILAMHIRWRIDNIIKYANYDNTHARQVTVTSFYMGTMVNTMVLDLLRYLKYIPCMFLAQHHLIEYMEH